MWKCVVDFIPFKLNIIRKNWKSVFEPPFGGLRGNVRTPSIARWKARDRLPIGRNYTFSLSLTVETLEVEISRSRRVLKVVGHFRRIFRVEGDNSQQPASEWKDYRYPCFVWCWDIDRRLFRFVTIHASDRQTYRMATAIPCVALHAVAR